MLKIFFFLSFFFPPSKQVRLCLPQICLPMHCCCMLFFFGICSVLLTLQVRTLFLRLFAYTFYFFSLFRKSKLHFYIFSKSFFLHFLTFVFVCPSDQLLLFACFCLFLAFYVHNYKARLFVFNAFFANAFDPKAFSGLKKLSFEQNHAVSVASSVSCHCHESGPVFRNLWQLTIL
jgi:hypothetical protein